MIKRENNGTGERETKKEERPTSLAFSFHLLPHGFSLDICLAFARLCFSLSRTINENHRGVLLKCLVGVCCPVLNILTLFQTKNVIFRTRFQTWPLKSIPVFRPGGGHKTQHKHWHETEIMSSLLRLNVQQKDFLKSISNSHITLSFLFIWKATNTLIHHRSSFVNHNRFKNEQSVYPFSDQNKAKTLPDGPADAYKSSIREYPPGEQHTKEPPARQRTKSNSCLIG